MLASERRSLLIDEVNRTGQLVTSEIAARLGVSEVTVRADLDELARRGRISRTHGGAVAVSPSSSVDGFDKRMSMQRDAKRRIALAAAELIRDDETVIFDAGTTVHHLALALPETSNLTVFTPGINIAQYLLAVDGVNTHLMGGLINPAWLETIGTPREQGIKDLIAQTLFLGAQGVDDDLDIVDPFRDLALSKLQFARRSRSIVLMIDSTKWATPAPAKVMPLERVDVVITDSGIPAEVRKRVEALDVELIVV